MTKSGIRLAVAALACSALSLGACWAEEPKKEGAAPAAEAPKAAAPAAEAPKAAAPAAEAPKAAAPAAAPAAASANPDNAEVDAKAKELGIKYEDGRYRDKDGNPVPIVTKDYKVDWGTWDGFRRYHDACHVCHGPNAMGSTFAPSLADSLKTMDYTTFVQTVSMGRTRKSRRHDVCDADVRRRPERHVLHRQHLHLRQSPLAEYGGSGDGYARGPPQRPPGHFT